MLVCPFTLNLYSSDIYISIRLWLNKYLTKRHWSDTIIENTSNAGRSRKRGVISLQEGVWGVLTNGDSFLTSSTKVYGNFNANL